MIIIPIQAIPNQSLTIQLEDLNFFIRLRSCNTNPQVLGTAIVSISIAINETVIIDNQRMVPGWPLIGYQYLENGNFYILTENDDYPDYTQFGNTQYLIYASATELEALRNGLVY
jgi:hypothetical protein